MPTPIVSNDGESTPDASGVKPEDSSQTVAYETFSKLLGQKKAQDALVKEQADKLAKFELAENQKREDQLRAEQKHEQIIAELKAQNEQQAAHLAKVQTDIVSSIKLQAVERETGGFAHPEYSKFVQLESIPLLEDGSVDQAALAKEAARIREVHPHLLKQAFEVLPVGAPRSAFQPNVPKTPKEVSWEDALDEHFKGK